MNQKQTDSRLEYTSAQASKYAKTDGQAENIMTVPCVGAEKLTTVKQIMKKMQIKPICFEQGCPTFLFVGPNGQFLKRLRVALAISQLVNTE